MKNQKKRRLTFAFAIVALCLIGTATMQSCGNHPDGYSLTGASQ